MSAINNYLSGFGNHFQSEAIAGALPKKQNSPQQPALGLYAEQISGSAFTAPRANNLHSWLYRINPSVKQSAFSHYQHSNFNGPMHTDNNPSARRWFAPPLPKAAVNFIDSLFTLSCHCRAAIYLYACNQSMVEQYFYNADGEMLIVPQLGKLEFATEFGVLQVTPGEIITIPRGIKFQVRLLEPQARGYICENFNKPFTLPELGPIGANGLAERRHFLSPQAHFNDDQTSKQLLCKFQNQLWQATINHSPLDVVAWHGNYAPYKYDLSRFAPMNSVRIDHADPSIFTVLTAASDTPGVANIDFVIFPPRWTVAENTFRVPYYHRNIMSEFMGLIHGIYDGKKKGFEPGGSSIHNCMTAHGPDTDTFNAASQATLKPQYIDNTMAFMFESSMPWLTTKQAVDADFRDKDYGECWQQLPVNFKT